MCKKTTALAIVAFVSAICACVLLATAKITEASREKASGDVILIDDIHMSKVAGAALVNGNGSVALIVEDNAITCVDAPKDTGVSESTMKSFLYYMAHMPAIQKLDTIDDLSDYGLDHPSATVSIIEKNGDVIKICLGDKTPFDEGWYAAVENDFCVYIVDDITARMMRYGIDDFRALDVLPELPSDLTLDDMTLFSITHNGEKLELHGEKETGTTRYRLSAPFEAALNWEVVAQKIYSPLSCLDECTYVSTGVDPDVYGLMGDNAYTLTYTLRNMTWTLHLFDAGDGTFYVCRDGSKQVVKVSDELLSYLNLQASDLVSDTVYSVPAANIDKVHIIAKQVDQTVLFNGAGETLRAQINGKDLDQKKAISLVQTLTMLPATGTLDDETDISATPILSMEFSLRDGTVNVISVIPITQTECAVVIDGSSSAATLRSTVDEVVREIQACLAN